jgi:hypothetical protein
MSKLVCCCLSACRAVTFVAGLSSWFLRDGRFCQQRPTADFANLLDAYCIELGLAVERLLAVTTPPPEIIRLEMF